MSKKEKLIERLKQKPKDFTFEEAVQLMGFSDTAWLRAEKQEARE